MKLIFYSLLIITLFDFCGSNYRNNINNESKLKEFGLRDSIPNSYIDELDTVCSSFHLNAKKTKKGVLITYRLKDESKNSTFETCVDSTTKVESPDMIQPVEVVYTQPTDFEIKMLEGTKNPAQLLEEEHAEKLKKQLEVITSSEIDKRREIVTRLKVVALDRLGKHPLTNPSYLSQREKTKLIHLMTSLQEDKEEDVIKEFNDICNDVLFSGKSDPSTFPVYRY